MKSAATVRARAGIKRRRLLAIGSAVTGITLAFAFSGAVRNGNADRLAVGGRAAVTKTDGTARVNVIRSVDANHDKLFDTLDRKLARLGAQKTVGIIAVLNRPATPALVGRLSARFGGLSAVRRFTVIDGFSARATREQARALAQRPEVAHVELDGSIRVTNDTPQQYFGVSAARAQVPGLDGDKDGSAAYTKNDLVAAVLDTGIDATHLDLAGKVIGWYDVVNGRTTPYDDNGHGTHVSATLAGSGAARADRQFRGVAPGAALVGVKVTPADGVAIMSNVVTGLQWVVANKATYNIKVVNLSLGAVGCWDGTEAVSQAVNNAVAAGLVVVVAAGNGGGGLCTIKAPGAAAGAITVGNMADPGAGGYFLRYDSSRGPTADGRMKPDIVGPGYQVDSAAAGTKTGYKLMDGTSMATPFVAGLALLMLEQKPTLTPAQIKDALHNTAADWGRGGNSSVPGSTGPDVDYGWGRLDAFAALKSIGVAVTTPPTVPAHRELEGSLTGTSASVDLPISIANVSYPVAATLTIPNASTTKNFDLTLLSPSGAVVSTSTRTDRTDFVVGRITTPGTYRLRVNSVVGAGDFFVDVSAGFGAPSGNLLANGSFENGFAGWAGDDASLSLATDGKAGPMAAKVTRTGTPSSYSIVSTPHPLTYTQAGQSFVGDGWVRMAAGTRTICETIREVSDTGTLYGSAQRCVSASTTWIDLAAFSYVAKRTGSELELVVTQSGARTGDKFEVDGLTLSAGAAPTDTVAPETTITGGPTGQTSATTATFTFTSSEPGGSLQCSLDNAAYTACTSPKTYSSLSVAQHTFRARAIDAAGKVDASPASRTWTVTVPSPDTTIVSAPANGVTDRSATIAFTSDTSGVHYECALDAAAFAACTSPVTYNSLALGQHTVKVRAINAANTPDPTPATTTWTIAASAPAGANLLPNPGFETGTGGWSFYQSTLAVSTTPEDGVQALSVSFVSGSTGGYTTYALPRPVKPTAAATAYTASGYLRSSKPGQQVCLSLREWSSANTVVGLAQSCLIATATWQQFPPVSYTTKQSGGSIEYYAIQTPGNDGDSFELDTMSLNGPADTTAPETTITTAPVDSSSTTATLAFSANEPGTFECSLDGAAFAACSSPATYTGLAVGAHTFAVRAKDLVGNVDATPATATWTVAAPAPDTTITSAPASGVTDGDTTLAFTSDTAGVTFECALDGAAFAACSSPQSYAALAAGDHTFQVRARNGGTVDATPASVAWTIASASQVGPNLLPNPGFESGIGGWSFFQSTLAPASDAKAGSGALAVSIVPGNGYTGFTTYALPRPAKNLVTGTPYTASGYLRSDKPGRKVCLMLREWSSANAIVGSSNSCLVGTGTWQQFPPVAYTTQQAGGSLEYVVSQSGSTDGDGFELDAMSLNGPVDATAPETTITNPPADSSSTSVSIAFTATEPSTFECSLDGAAFAPCSSPAAYSGLALGSHAFAVRATDLASNADSTPATASWNVVAPPDTTAPETTLPQPMPATTTDTTANLAFTATEPASFQCALDGADWASCSSPQSFDGLGVGQHIVQVRATDTAGNVDATPASTTWTILAVTSGTPNLLSNGSFETGLGGWTSWQSTLATASDATDGSQAAKASANSGITGFSISAAPRPVRTGLVAGDSYTAGGYVRSDSPGKKVCLTLREWDSAGVAAALANSCVVATGSWQRFPSVAYTLKGSGGQLDLYAIEPTGVGGDSFEVDALTLRVATAPSDTTAPDTTITSAAQPATTLSTDASFTFTGTEPGYSQCSLDGASFATCKSPLALTGLSSGQHTFQVRAVDNAGNVDQTPASQSWTIVGSPNGPNLLGNGGFEKGLTGWAGSGGTLALATDAQEGTQAAKITVNAGVTGFTLITAPRPVRSSTVAGTVYGATGWVRSDTPGKKVCLKIREWAGGASVNSGQACLTLTSDWQQLPQVVYTTQASGGDVEILLSESGAVAGDSFEADGLSLQASS